MRRIQRRWGSERVTTVPKMKKVLHEEWDGITIEEIKRSHNSLQRSPGASLSRVGIIITLESLPARDTGWPWGGRVAAAHWGKGGRVPGVLSWKWGTGGFHFVIQAGECNAIG